MNVHFSCERARFLVIYVAEEVQMEYTPLEGKPHEMHEKAHWILTLGDYIDPKIVIGQIIGFGKIDSFRSIESILWSIHYPNFQKESMF